MSETTMIGKSLGRFQILSELGRGGMAVVYKARQADLDRIVALKLLPPSLTHDESYVARFRQEARSAARLEHPHIMPIYEVGEADGHNYIAMKFIQGRTLKQLVEDDGALTVPRAAQILAQVGEALDHAHRQGVIHRDIKPSNVMITDEGWVYLTDFGLARGTGGTSGLTMAGTVMGTPEYMSPEQAQGLPNVGPPTDIYALGVMLYELLTGTFPFKGETPMAMLAARLLQAPTPPRDVRGDLPPSVEDVVMRSLARKPEARFATAAEMVAALRQAVGMTAAEADRPLTPLAGMPTALAGPPPTPYGGVAAPRPASQPAYAPPGSTPPYVQPQRPTPPPQPYQAAQPYQAQLPPTQGLPSLPGGAAPAARGGRGGLMVGLGVGAVAIVGLIIGAVFLLRPGGGTPTPTAAALSGPAAEQLAAGDAALARPGELAAAVAAYQAAVDAAPASSIPRARLAMAQLAQADWGAASATAEELASAGDATGRAYGHAIQGYIGATWGDLVGAQAASERAIAADAGLGLGYAVRALALARRAEGLGDEALMVEAFDAIGAAEDALADDEPLGRALTNITLAYTFAYDHRLSGDQATLDQAFAAADSAIALQPALGMPHVDLAAIYSYFADDNDAARDEVAAALELDPELSDAQALLGWMAYFEGDQAAAGREFDAALAINPDDAQAHAGLGLLAFDEGEWQDAIDALETATELQPAYSYAFAYLGEARLFAGFNTEDDGAKADRYAQAEAAYRQAVEIDDSYAFAMSGLGWILQYQEEYNDSVATFERALAIDDENDESHNGLGWSLFYLDRFPEAEQAFRRAIELDPSYADAHFGLGRAYEEQGRREDALAEFQETRRLRPSYSGVDAAIERVSN